MQPRQSTADGSDIGYLKLNGNNVLTLQTGPAGTEGPYSLIVICKTQAFTIEDSNGNVSLNYA